MKSLIKSSVGRISTSAILLVCIIVFILILKQAGIVTAENESATGYDLASITENSTLNISSNESTPPNENITELNQGFNETSDILINETIIEINESLWNQSIIIPNVSETVEQIINFEISLDYPGKITRGETIKVKAIATNTGSSIAKNVVLDWKIPEGFEIVSGNQREFCGKVEANGNCISEIDLKTSLSTSLGLNEVKVVVNYE